MKFLNQSAQSKDLFLSFSLEFLQQATLKVKTIQAMRAGQQMSDHRLYDLGGLPWLKSVVQNVSEPLDSNGPMAQPFQVWSTERRAA